MWSAVSTLISSLPSWYVMILLPFLICGGVWVFGRIRIDKNGKRYFYSQKFEDRKRNEKQDKLLGKLDNVLEMAAHNRKDILQLQLCSNIPKPGKRVAYLEYVGAGFNSWADQYVIDQGLYTEEEVRYIKTNNKAPGWVAQPGVFSRRAEDKKLPPEAKKEAKDALNG